MIEIRGLNKKYVNTPVIKDLSFILDPGARMAIFGPSGTGKTTLLRLIAGLELPDEGEISIAGSLASNKKYALAPYRRGIGYVLQSPALWPHMTVAQNIMFGLEGLDKRQAPVRLNEVMEQTGVAELSDRYPDEISGGQARRVSLARTLAPKPKRYLMDEPLVNLDSKWKERLLQLIDETVTVTGASLIYVTHDREEVQYISDNILFLENKETY
ncbi:MAG: ABC transporter ATP-binding protein [Acidobacteriota bacterium]